MFNIAEISVAPTSVTRNCYIKVTGKIKKIKSLNCVLGSNVKQNGNKSRLLGFCKYESLQISLFI